MEKAPVFVSLTGTQAMGTLQGLMGLHASVGPMPIRLLHTDGTKAEAERLEEIINLRSYGDVELIPVDYTTDSENSAPAVIERIAASAKEEGRRICYNLNGGLNYLVAVTVLRLEPYHPIYIQPTHDRIVLTDTETETHSQLRLPPPLHPLDLLKLQDVPFSMAAKNPEANKERPLSMIIREEGMRVPEPALRNVQIDKYVFDYVWNDGSNSLCFLKEWRPHIDSSRDAKEAAKESERDFAHWSMDRERCSSLHDKKVYALVDSRKSEARLRDTSNGQLTPIFYEKPKGRNEASEAVQELNRIIGRKPPKIKEQELKEPAPVSATPLRDDTLVVCVGRGVQPTLTAIGSHRPKHLVLCYTKSQPLVAGHTERLLAVAKHLGVETIEAVNFSFEGVFADKTLPAPGPDKPRVVVNISPGTKGQTAMLTRWAARHGFEIWSLHTGEKRCAPLAAPADAGPLPYRGIDPAGALMVKGVKILNPGKSAQELEPEFPWLDAMLAFMRELDAAGTTLDQAFAAGYIKLGENSLKIVKKGTWRLLFNGRKYDFIKNDGAWFEKLCARALLKAGASHIRLNFKVDWDENAREEIETDYKLISRDRRKRDTKEPFEMEIDVLGTFEGDTLLLSAKAYDLFGEGEWDGRKDYEAAEQNVASGRGIFDKFTLGLLAHLGATKAQSGEKVRLIGWREICHPEKLAAIIRELSASKSTTRKG